MGHTTSARTWRTARFMHARWRRADLIRELRALQAEPLIREVISRYAVAVDRPDYELLRSCYHPDARHQRGDFNGNVDETIRWIGSIRERVLHSWHLIGSPLIEIDGNVALADTSCLAIQRVRAGSGDTLVDRVTPCRYVDRFVCVNDVWRIVHRVGRYEPAQELPVTSDVGSPNRLFGPIPTPELTSNSSLPSHVDV